MTDRLKSLRRISAVQTQMVKLAEWRLVNAERTCREIAETQVRLQAYVVDEGALGVPLARAALRSLHKLDDQREEADRARARSKTALQAAKQREKTVEEATTRVSRVQARVDEDKTLATTVEAWLSAERASLP